jgi:hypothetical protein
MEYSVGDRIDMSTARTILEAYAPDYNIHERAVATRAALAEIDRLTGELIKAATTRDNWARIAEINRVDVERLTKALAEEENKVRDLTAARDDQLKAKDAEIERLTKVGNGLLGSYRAMESELASLKTQLAAREQPAKETPGYVVKSINEALAILNEHRFGGGVGWAPWSYGSIHNAEDPVQVGRCHDMTMSPELAIWIAAGLRDNAPPAKEMSPEEIVDVLNQFSWRGESRWVVSKTFKGGWLANIFGGPCAGPIDARLAAEKLLRGDAVKSKVTADSVTMTSVDVLAERIERSEARITVLETAVAAIDRRGVKT